MKLSAAQCRLYEVKISPNYCRKMKSVAKNEAAQVPNEILSNCISVLQATIFQTLIFSKSQPPYGQIVDGSLAIENC